jgi:phospholipase C
MAKPKVVILMLENRSFDEFFGTFPGAIGFYDTSANAAAFTQSGFANNPGAVGGVSANPADVQYLPPIRPFRASSFSTTNARGEEFGVFWDPQHYAWNYGAMNGWSMKDNPSTSDHTVMSYAAANDIPYFWTLAQNFLLCDTYFCSIMGSTTPNRMIFMSGTIFAPDTLTGSTLVIPFLDGSIDTPVINNTSVDIQSWPSYPNILGTNVPWTIYDDQSWAPNWLAWTKPQTTNPADTPLMPSYIVNVLPAGWPSISDGGYNTLYILDGEPGGTSLGHPGDPTTFILPANGHPGHYYSATASPVGSPLLFTDAPPSPSDDQSNFEIDALHGNLPDVSWIIPPAFFIAHPTSGLPTDAECYVARLVNAMVNSPHWDNEGIVFILTFDENDGQFDHVRPPASMSDQLRAYGTGGAIAPLQTPLLRDVAGGPVTLTMPAQPSMPPPGMPWEPWINGGSIQAASVADAVTGPAGAGFRVPTIIISPWTYRAGVSSKVQPTMQFDHTSIIQYLEEITGIVCTNLPPLTAATPMGAWRRNTFKSLGELIDTSNTPATSATVNASLATAYNSVGAWRLDVLTRLYGATTQTTPPPFQPGLNQPGPTPQQVFPPIQQQCYLIMNKTTFGQDEVEGLSEQQNQGNPNGPVTFQNAFWVVVDGFEPAEVGLAHVPSAPGYLSPQVTVALTLPGQTLSGVTVTPHPTPMADSTPLVDVGQRFRYACDINFPNGASVFDTLGVSLNSVVTLEVSASFTSRLTFPAPDEQIELVATPDPYIQNGPTLIESDDLRVYTLVADGVSSLFGATQLTLDPTNPDPLLYIQNLLAWLNGNPGSWPPAPADPEDPSAAATEAGQSTVTVYPTENGDPALPLIFNFGVVRVGMQGVSEKAPNVRVFFRLFPAQSTGTAYNPATLYRCTPATTMGAANPADAAVDQAGPNPVNSSWPTRVPLLGIGAAQPTGSDVASIPFFAVQRADATQQSMAQQPPDWPNTQQIVPNPDGETVYKFFGCWLDINLDASSNTQGSAVEQYAQTSQYPSLAPTTPGSQDGPYPPPLQPVKAFAMGQHQCIVAEVVYDSLPPIATGTIPGDSDKLVQRNLTVQGGVNV